MLMKQLGKNRRLAYDFMVIMESMEAVDALPNEVLLHQDDGSELTDYDFATDAFVGTAFDDDQNKKKLDCNRSTITNADVRHVSNAFASSSGGRTSNNGITGLSAYLCVHCVP
ncbi:hypothetical protein Tco_1004480 [Tanacetum coccineum]|uniref:Uncharacterized protein n=1 Tax=Tanacetum coccineum TaxID=301880 RepID=A0ABQ5FCH7_9ASTR